MDLAFNIVLHLLLLSSFAVFDVALLGLVMRADDSMERLMRTLALFAGALVVIGGQVAGLSYADFIVKSFTTTQTTSVGLLGWLLPAVAGIGCGWYFVHTTRRSETLALRFLAFIGMLATAQFAQVYTVAVQEKGLELGSTAVPNICFCLGVILYLMTKWMPNENRNTSRSGVGAGVRAWMEGRRPSGPATAAVEGSEPPAAVGPIRLK